MLLKSLIKDWLEINTSKKEVTADIGAAISSAFSSDNEMSYSDMLKAYDKNVWIDSTFQTSGYMLMKEDTAVNVASNYCMLIVKDDGDGTQTLYVRFDDETEVAIANN